MTEIERTPEEINETGKNVESPESRQLDDATFEPGSLIEQNGDYRQAEDIQRNLEQAVNESHTDRDVGATPLPIPKTLDEAGERTSLADDAGRPIEFEQPTQARQGLDQETDLGQEAVLGGPRAPGFTGLPGEEGSDSQGGIASRNLPSELGNAGISVDDMLDGASGNFQGMPGEQPGMGTFHPKYGVGGGGPGSLVSEEPDGGGFPDTTLQDYLADEADKRMMDDIRDEERRLGSDIAHSGESPDKKSEADIILEEAWNAHVGKPQQVDDDEVPPDQKPPDSTKMPRPDGGDSGGDVKNIDPSEVKPPSERISDPAYTQGMGIGSGGFENTKHPGLVTDPAEWQDSGKPSKDARTTSGSEKVSDPAEPEDGKKSNIGR